MERAIIHLNIADFAVAVERHCDSRLRQRPVIIAAPSSSRATVYDMSEEAYQNGIRKGMTVRHAVRLCRDVLLIPPHPERYQKATSFLLQAALPFSPLVEPVDSNGHLFLDVSRSRKLFGPPSDIARHLRRAVIDRLGITPIWTLATNKLVAKLTSRLVKPLGEHITVSGDEEKILAPCPLALLPGLEFSDIELLRQFNISRIGELATLSPAQLAIPFGRRGGHLHELAHGIDYTPVFPPDRKPTLIEKSRSFTGGSNDCTELEKALFGLAEQMGTHLRQLGKASGKISLTLLYSDHVKNCRQANLAFPSADEIVLFTRARHLLHSAWHRRVRLATLRLACLHLTSPPPPQMELFNAEPNGERSRLLPALDTIRQRFGNGSIQWGKMMEKLAVSRRQSTATP